MELGQNIDLINQHRLYLNNKVLRIHTNNSSIDDILISILEYSKSNHSFIILNEEETINESEYFEAICNLIKSLPNEIYIMQSSLTKHLYSVEPLLNLIQWKYGYIRNKPSDTKDTLKIFPNNLFDKSYKTNKSNKLILSIRSDNDQRDYLKSRLKNNYDGIVRLNTDSDVKWPDLLKEYGKSLFSFVVETNYPTTTNLSSVTEKSVIPFITNSIPIVLGKQNIVRDLEDCGFWIANKDFGFDIEDTYVDYSKSKVNAYVRCLEIINKLSYKKCLEYYNQNIDRIKTNRKIIVDLYQEKYLKKLV